MRFDHSMNTRLLFSVSFEAYQKPRIFEEAVSVVQRVNSSF